MSAFSIPAKALERLPLDAGWRFHLGDVPRPEIKGHNPSYNNAKAWGAADPEFDDSDWVVEGPFDENANISQGCRPRGFSWYRRHFRLDEADRGKHLEIHATHSSVWINGLVAHRNPCGDTSFQIDLTPIATYGDQLNTTVVRAEVWLDGAKVAAKADPAPAALAISLPVRAGRRVLTLLVQPDGEKAGLGGVIHAVAGPQP